jgi:hypothetical protein
VSVIVSDDPRPDGGAHDADGGRDRGATAAQVVKGCAVGHHLDVLGGGVIDRQVRG